MEKTTNMKGTKKSVLIVETYTIFLDGKTHNYIRL